jgi:hypothetical protein
MLNHIGLLFEFFVFSGPVLLWCGWELWSLKREKAKDAAAAAAKEAAVLSGAAGHAKG